MSPHCRYVDGDRLHSIHADVDDGCVEEPAQRDDRRAMHRGQSLDVSAMKVTRSCLSRRGGGEGELADAPVRPRYLTERTLLVRPGVSEMVRLWSKVNERYVLNRFRLNGDSWLGISPVE